MPSDNAKGCGREHDLIGYLYGELSSAERNLFQAHLSECTLCSAEVSELGSVRQSIVAWRDESLNFATLPVQAAVAERRSALTALRAFFDLSPLWMKGAIGFAAVLFCVVGVLAILQLRGSSQSVAPSNQAQYVAPDINKLVDERVKQELAKRANAEAATPKQEAIAFEPAREVQRQVVHVVRNQRVQNSQRPLSRTEREELATDLRLTATANDRGVGLLEDINQ